MSVRLPACALLVSLALPTLAFAGPDERSQADDLANKGDITAAVALYKKLLTQSPGDDSVILALANALSWSKRVDDQRASLPWFDRHLHTHPDDLDARLTRARVRSWVGDIAGAERDYRVVLRTKKTDDLELELAKALSWSKVASDQKRSLEIYDRFVKKRPEDQGLRLERGRVRSWTGDSSGACDDFDAWLKKHPDDKAVRLDRARALLWGGDYGAAESALDDLSKEASVRDDADVERARLYAQTNRRLLGLDLLDDVLARSPTHAEARAEHDKLAISDDVAVHPSWFTFGDRTSIVLNALRLDASFPVVRNVRILADVAGWTLSNSKEVLLAGRGDLGAWFRIPRVLEVEGAAGPRFYQYYSPKVGGHATVRAQPASFLHLDATWHYDDLYSDLYQPATVVVGIQGHLLAATAELSLPYHIDISGRVGARFAEPSNADFEASATAMIRIVDPIHVGYSVEWLGWKYNDPAYWSPQGYAAHMAVLRLSHDFSFSNDRSLSLEATGEVGAAAERIDGIKDTGFGPAFGFSGAATLVVSPHFSAGFSVQYGYTQRRVFEQAGSQGTACENGTQCGTPTTVTVTSTFYDWITSTLFMDVHF